MKKGGKNVKFVLKIMLAFKRMHMSVKTVGKIFQKFWTPFDPFLGPCWGQNARKMTQIRKKA